MTKDQAFAACMEMQYAFFLLADSTGDPMAKGLFRAHAVKAGQVAGYILPGIAPDAPANDAPAAGDAA